MSSHIHLHVCTVYYPMYPYYLIPFITPRALNKNKFSNENMV